MTSDVILHFTEICVWINVSIYRKYQNRFLNEYTRKNLAVNSESLILHINPESLILHSK